MRIPNPKKNYTIFVADKGLDFQKLSYGSETSDMTTNWLGDMFENRKRNFLLRRKTRAGLQYFEHFS